MFQILWLLYGGSLFSPNVVDISPPNVTSTYFYFLSSQFIQQVVGAQERAHPQVCSRELLFFDEKGELIACEQMSNTSIYVPFFCLKCHLCFQ